MVRSGEAAQARIQAERISALRGFVRAVLVGPKSVGTVLTRHECRAYFATGAKPALRRPSCTSGFFMNSFHTNPSR